MAVTLQSGTASSRSSGQSASVTFSGYTPLAGDIVFIFAGDAGVRTPSAAPAGWVNPLGGTTNVASDANSATPIYHIVTAGEQTAVTTTYSCNIFSGVGEGQNSAVVLRGVDNAAIIDSIATTFDSANAATPHLTAQLLGANLSTNSYVVNFFYCDGVVTWTAAAGWTLRGGPNSTGITTTAACYSRDALTTAGTNVTAASFTPSAGNEIVTVTVAFTAAATATVVRKNQQFNTAVRRASLR